MASKSGIFEVLYGPIDKPLDEWEIQNTFPFDATRSFNLYEPATWPPQYIQERYVRRENFDLEWSHKHAGRPLTHRYMMRQVPAEQDYVKRCQDNGWEIWKDYHFSNHFCLRLSEDKKTFTYYETEKDARLDRSKSISVLSFIRKYYSSHENDVQNFCARYNLPYAHNFELKFAKTREEIRWVYENGPNSCMAGNRGAVHPCEAYACDELAVAYLVEKGDPEATPSARAVVNGHNKTYWSTYGATTQLQACLREAGYSHNNNGMKGYRILNLVDANEAPYPDYRGSHNISACRKYQEIAYGTHKAVFPADPPAPLPEGFVDFHKPVFASNGQPIRIVASYESSNNIESWQYDIQQGEHTWTFDSQGLPLGHGRTEYDCYPAFCYFKDVMLSNTDDFGLIEVATLNVGLDLSQPLELSDGRRVTLLNNLMSDCFEIHIPDYLLGPATINRDGTLAYPTLHPTLCDLHVRNVEPEPANILGAF